MWNFHVNFKPKNRREHEFPWLFVAMLVSGMNFYTEGGTVVPLVCPRHEHEYTAPLLRWQLAPTTNGEGVKIIPTSTPGRPTKNGQNICSTNIARMT